MHMKQRVYVKENKDRIMCCLATPRSFPTQGIPLACLALIFDFGLDFGSGLV
jgi:hypothetical protein